jgi:hypothetical protein
MRVSNLKALAKSYFCGGFVKLANDGTCIEIVIGHNGMNLLPFCPSCVGQRRDELAGFSLLTKYLSVQVCCRDRLKDQSGQCHERVIWHMAKSP